MAAASPEWDARIHASLADIGHGGETLLDALRAGKTNGSASARMTDGTRVLRWTSRALDDAWLVVLDVLPALPDADGGRFKHIFNAAFEFISVVSPTGIVLEVNAAALRLGGLEAADVVGRKLWETYWFRLSEDAQARVQEAVERAAAGQFVRHELMVWSADERPTPIDFSLIPVPDAQGTIPHLIVEGRDISGLYQARKRLEETQRILLHAQRMAGMGSWQWHTVRGDITWSDEVHRIFDLPPDEAVTFDRYLSRIHPDDRDALQQCVSQALATQQGYALQHRVVWPDGHTRHVHSVAEISHDDEGHLVLTGIVHDLTDRILADQAMRESEARFRLLAENASDVVCLHAPDGAYRYISPSIERTLGYEPEALLGTSPYDLLHPEDAAHIRDDEHPRLLKGEAVKTVARLRHRDGHYRWMESFSRPHFDEEGNIQRIQSSTRDVTERIEAEQALAQTLQTLEQRNRELQDFAYVASHDLQEPLRKIRAFSDLLRQESADRLDESNRHYLARIEDAAERMTVLINDLLTFSRIATRNTPLQPVNLAQIAEGVLRDLEIAIQEAGAVVEVDDLPVLAADAMQMRQLLQNLIGNALKFSAPGRPPHVRICSRVRNSGQHRVLVLEVADNGIGFDEKYTDRIFSPFQRLHHRAEYPGTGMGLAICRRIAERHGGQLTARSTPGEGASFIVTLPFVSPSPLPPDHVS